MIIKTTNTLQVRYIIIQIDFERKDDVTHSEFSVDEVNLHLILSYIDQNRITGFDNV